MASGVAPSGNRLAGLFGLGTLALVLGAAWFAAGGLRGDEPPVTTSSVPPFAIAGDGTTFAFADPLQWEPAVELGGFLPRGTATIDGHLIVYGWDEAGGALLAMMSEDGRTWQSAGEVISSTDQVFGVRRAGDAVVAQTAPRQLGTAPTVWIARDGLSFTPLEIPAFAGSQGSGWSIDFAAVRGDTVLVVAQEYSDPFSVINEALPEQFRGAGPYSGDVGPYSVAFSPFPTYRVIVHGPLGIPVWTATAAQLGTTEEELANLFDDPSARDGTHMFVTEDGDTWQEAWLPVTWIHDLDVGADGRFVAVGSSDGGSKTSASEDGLIWTSESSYDSIEQLAAWGSGWVGSRYRGSSPQLIRSGDAAQWEEIDLDLLLPGGHDWSFSPIIAGDAGVAAVVHAFDDPFFEEPPPPVRVQRDGYELVADDTVGSIRLTREAIETHRIAMWSGVAPDDIAVDFETDTLTFLDAESGEELVTFSFAELTAADEARWEGPDPSFENGIIFSADGVAWTFDDAADVFAGDRVLWLMLDDDVIVAVVGGISEGVLAATEIWTASLP